MSNEEQALVCIYKENEVYGVKKTSGSDGMHKATFDCKPDTVGKIRIVATCPNHLYDHKTITVTSKPYVHLYITDFNPTDLYLHRGENSFNIVLKNEGTVDDATNVNSTLSSLSQYVIINLNPPTSTFDVIGYGESQQSKDKFTITVSDDAPNIVFIRLLLTIQCDQGEFSEEFVLQVKASQLEYRGNKIAYTSINNDIFIQPGEDVQFRVELLNTGSQNAEIQSATIDRLPILNYYYYSVTDDLVSFNTIGVHDTSWCIGLFKIRMNENLEIYNTFPVKLNIEDIYGKNYEDTIYVNNTMTPDHTGFISDEASITLFWDAISGAGGYNIYRLDPDRLPAGGNIEDSTLYQRLNLYVNQFSTYKDVDVEPNKEYYYKLSCYWNSGLPQGPFTRAFKAWTPLPELDHGLFMYQIMEHAQKDHP